MAQLIRVLFFILLLSTVAGATSRVTVNLSAQDLEAGFDLDFGQVIESYGQDTYFLGVHFLNTQDSAGYQMFRVHALMENDMAQSDNIRIAIGMKAILTNISGVGYLAFPVGGHIDYKLPEMNGVVSVTGDLFYAPAPLSVDPASSYFESRLGGSAEPVENMRVFLEWRLIFTNFSTQTAATLFNHTFAFGMRIGI